MTQRNQHTPWPAEDVAKLRQLRDEGKSNSQIGRALNKTRSACAGMAYRLGLSLPADRSRYCVATPKACKPKREPRVKVVVVKAVKAPPPPPPPPPVVCLAQARPFMSRASRECAWLLDDGRSCCGPVTRGSYCAGHAAQVYRPTATFAADKMARKYG